LKEEVSRGKISLVGDSAIAGSIENWMIRSSYANC
jgi:hypothetical protein